MKTLIEYLKKDPTVINRDNNGNIRSLLWTNQNNQMHSVNDLPAYISVHPNGSIGIEAWYINGVEHRGQGPALITYTKEGRVGHKVWYTAGIVHRNDKPAFIEYFTTLAQSIKRVEYRSNGKIHRNDGPAVIKYNSLGQTSNERWYDNGVLNSQTVNELSN